MRFLEYLVRRFRNPNFKFADELASLIILFYLKVLL